MLFWGERASSYVHKVILLAQDNVYVVVMSVKKEISSNHKRDIYPIS